MRKKTLAVILLAAILCMGWLAPSARAGSSADTDDYKAWSSYDSRWKTKQMNDVVPMGGYGCLVTAVAKLMVQAGLTMPDGSEINPGKFCDWLNRNSGFVSGTGNYIWSKAFSFGFDYYKDTFHGYGSYSSAADNDQIIEWINEGWHMVIMVNGGNHWINVDEELSLATGTVYIMDSDSNLANNSNKTLASRYPTYNQVRAYRGGTTPFPNGKEMTSGGDRVLPDGDYIIANAGYTGKPNLMYLDFDGGAKPAAGGTNAIITGPTATDSVPEVDVWTLTWLNNGGYYKITQKGTSMALNVQGGSVKSGTNIAAHTYAGHKNEQWAISFNGSNGYRIQARHSGFNVGLGGSTANGTNVQQAVGRGSGSQGWLFIPYKPSQPIANGEYVLLSDVNMSRELDVPGDTADVANNSKLQIWQDWEADGYYNTFNFTKLSNGYYKVIHTASGKAMEIYGGTSSPNDRVSLYTANGSSPQYWAVIPNGNDKYELVVQSSGYAMDLANAATANGSPVRQYPRNQSAAQTWHFRPAANTVSYNANGGTGAPASQKKYFMHDLTLSETVPTRTGYVFLGWGFDPDDTIPWYNPGAIFDLDINEDTTLYAIWDINKPGVRVSCMLNGREVPEGTTVGNFTAEVFSDGYHDKQIGVSSYFVELIEGSRYSITDITAANGYELVSVTGGEQSGYIGDSVINIVLNFSETIVKTQGLTVQFMLNGIPVDGLDGIGTFEVTAQGDRYYMNRRNCVRFSAEFSEPTEYTINNIITVQPYVFIGAISGELNGMLDGETKTVVLNFETVFEPQEEWQELNELPSNVDLTTCEVEYKNHYVYQGRTSPGEEWTLSAEGEIQYENDGELQYSDDPMTYDALRVFVGHYYFHWCNKGTVGNYFQRDYLPYKHTISMEDAQSHYEVVYYTMDGDRPAYRLRHLDGQWAGGYASCGAGGCEVYYEGDVYQNKKPYQINTYVWDSEWTSEQDPMATSVTVRIRLKTCYVTLFGNGPMCGSTWPIVRGGELDLGECLSAEPMEWNGYALTEFNTAEDGSGTSYATDAVITVNEDMNLFAQWETVTEIEIPAGIQIIEEEAFADSGARIVRIPYGCTTIKAKAFARCEHLKKVYIPETVKVIDNTAFDDTGELIFIGTEDSYAEYYAFKHSWISFEIGE